MTQTQTYRGFWFEAGKLRSDIPHVPLSALVVVTWEQMYDALPPPSASDLVQAASELTGIAFPPDAAELLFDVAGYGATLELQADYLMTLAR